MTAQKMTPEQRKEIWSKLEKFELSFDHKVRLFRSLGMDNTNSYCAAPGTVLKFDRLDIIDDIIVFRVRRNGRRSFFTTSIQLQEED
jgi:hypothetical protein